ncbi:ABC transporter substrate-binding protein [Chloroflexi bacterium TSY]|nr:ABC transporter substrate-binding protein [Chloroflexi bacterium TSY]
MKRHKARFHMLEHLYRSGRISRREFLRRTLVLSGGAVLAAACGTPAGGEGATGSATEGQPAAAPGEPRQGGIFRIAGPGDIRVLDPPGAESSEDWWSAGVILYNCLYFYDEEGNIYPDLAAEMPTISDDGLTYTIPVRQGVKFHNGRELVAEDVKFSLEHQIWPEVYSWGKGYSENIEGYQAVLDGDEKELTGIQVIDDYTVKIRLIKPQAVFPHLLTYSMNAIIPKQETLDAGEAWGNDVVIGTGPFKFVEWIRGEKTVYERNPDYFKGAPHLDGIELFLNVDASVQMLRFESGELEYVRVPPAETIPQLLSDSSYENKIVKVPTTGHRRLAFNYNFEPFTDIRVRQAVAHAIDKEGFVRAFGGTENLLQGFYNPTMLQFDEEFTSSYEYDPEKAKQMLADAGYGDGIQGLRMYIGNDSRAGELLQADLQNIGIETELVLGQWKEWRDPIRAGDPQLFVYGWASSSPDAYDYISAWTTCESIEVGYNDGFYCNERIDELVKEAEGLPLQDSERIAAYREIEDIVINQDVAWVGLANPVRISLVQEYMHDVQPFFIYGGWPFLDKAWMEEV